jgi:hypothetical protein
VAAPVCSNDLNTPVVLVPTQAEKCFVPCSGAANETCGEYGYVNLYSSPSVSPSRISTACVLCSTQTLVFFSLGSESNGVGWEDGVETGQGKGKGVMTRRWSELNIGALEDSRTGHD